jgi:hypothetical protein
LKLAHAAEEHVSRMCCDRPVGTCPTSVAGTDSSTGGGRLLLGSRNRCGGKRLVGPPRGRRGCRSNPILDTVRLIDRPGDEAVAAVLRRRELLGDAGTVDGTVPKQKYC